MTTAPETKLTPATSLADARRLLTAAFADAGLATPDLDARFLLQGLLVIDGAAFVVEPDRPLGESATRVREALARRLAREPVARILGCREFYGRTFAITPDVLDPRADTETVVDLALDIVHARGLDRAPIRIADIGTGSGILIATLLAELPAATGVATDISPAALAIAQANATALRVAARASFIETDMLSGLAGPFDLVVSNPPYIASQDIADLPPEVRNHDPLLALDGGLDGLAAYRKMASQISVLGTGLVVVEIGAGQLANVQEIFSLSRFRVLAKSADLGGHIRAVAFEIHS